MRTVTGDALDSEPFYRELHRRHPDVDIVVLAGQEPSPSEPVDVAVARRTADETRATFDEIWRLLSTEPADVEEAWRPGTVDGVVHTELSTRSSGIDRPRAEHLLREAADSLAARTWAVRVPLDGVPRVVAGRADVTARLTWWDDVLTLTVQGPGTSIGVEALRSLLAEETR